ncbi:MAG: hypothetical protein OXD54_03890 [Candidatus Poribacteria bacterium]|nr:hypothetical protein [Candidatus Poribacteria bacterium]
MTLIVSVISADGIVIAGDSLSSLNKQINMNKPAEAKCPNCGQMHTVKVNFQGNIGQATYSHTEKVFPFLENFGIGVFGSGLIGSNSVNFLIRSFEHSLKKENKFIDGVTNLAQDIGIHLHNLLKKQIEIEKKSLKDFPKNHTFLGFQVVGYDEFQPKIIEVSLGRNVISKPFDKLGCYASGNREVVTAIWNLYKSKPGIHPIYEVFSLQEAIDYVDFLISSTISFQRFSPITANVGGEIDIALVRPFGEFQWIRQKPLGELLEGGKHGTTKKH